MHVTFGIFGFFLLKVVKKSIWYLGAMCEGFLRKVHLCVSDDFAVLWD